MSSKNVMIICTDTYGKVFFKKLTNRLKNEKLIPNHRIYVERFNGPCSPKLERQLTIYACLREIDFVIIVADADGKPPTKIKKMIEVHIPAELKPSTGIVILEYEIEDWICISKGIRISDTKPSLILKQKEDYEKYKLCNYVSELKIGKLVSRCKSFYNFLKFLQH